jgi:hypothetical protein
VNAELCDFAGCELGIVRKCQRCGGSYCVRHIQEVAVFGREHPIWRCDYCEGHSAERSGAWGAWLFNGCARVFGFLLFLIAVGGGVASASTGFTLGIVVCGAAAILGVFIIYQHRAGWHWWQIGPD